MESRSSSVALSTWLKEVFSSVRALPRYLVPRYFHSVVMTAYQAVVEHSYSLMSPFVREGSELVRLLAQGDSSSINIQTILMTTMMVTTTTKTLMMILMMMIMT